MAGGLFEETRSVVVEGLMAEESGELLRNFFRARRQAPRKKV
jgi:hypothetical protein